VWLTVDSRKNLNKTIALSLAIYNQAIKREIEIERECVCKARHKSNC